MIQENLEGIIHFERGEDFREHINKGYPRLAENYMYPVLVPKSRYVIKREFGNLTKLDRNEYYLDALKVQKACQEHGYDLTLSEAEDLWSAYSVSVCASWIIVPETSVGIWWYIRPYFPELTDEEED